MAIVPAPIGPISFSGRGAIRQPLLGRFGVWLSLAWEAQLLPARAFLWRGRVTLLRLPLLRGSDEYRSGRGRLVIGRKVLEGEGVDRSEYAALWAWTFLLAPEVALARADVTVERVDSTTSRVLFPYGTETWECTLHLDPASRLLRRLDTHRFDLRTGHPRRWSFEVEGYRRADGREVPAAVVAAWEDEPAVRLELERVEAGGAGAR